MGLFSHDSDPETAEFVGLVLDEESLHTPAGSMPLAEMTRAEFVRTLVHDGVGPEETSEEAVVGGAVVGGAVFGAAGAVVGGLAGSTVNEEGREKLRTESVFIIFETPLLNYRRDIPREQERAAHTFAEAVRHAAKRYKK